MFEGSIPYYDRIYAFKDYAEEVEKLRGVIDARLHTGGRRLLDVACGTGCHLEHFAPHFEIAGLDLEPGFLEAARTRNPGARLEQGDMADFDLGATFDVLTCLFSSIGYLKRIETVERAAHAFFRHLVPGGLVLVEPWFTPSSWRPGSCHALFIDEPDFKLARVNTSHGDGTMSWLDLHHLVGTPEETVHFVERHEMGLFDTDALCDAFRRAGFDVDYDEEGPTGRGLLIGTRPAA